MNGRFMDHILCVYIKRSARRSLCVEFHDTINILGKIIYFKTDSNCLINYSPLLCFKITVPNNSKMEQILRNLEFKYTHIF